ncbi:MAG: hypothetical protein LBJ72_10835 [Dysgonamonadaceae bacterium]|jgi:hypothetical protein|nr:hypothetical protein [Dysgonamonadaceae bacterium]
MMDLEEVKKIWQEADSLKEQKRISDERIKNMLKNEGKSALDKLINTARNYTNMMIPLGIIICVFSYRFFEAGGLYPVCPLAMLLMCILLEPFEIYLYRLLKGIDYSTMTVREVNSRILKYQSIVKRWEFYGIAIFIVYMAIWYYLYYKLIFGDEIVWWFIIFTAAVYVAGIIAIPKLYKKLYYDNINKIKENLKELEEFE